MKTRKILDLKDRLTERDVYRYIAEIRAEKRPKPMMDLIRILMYKFIQYASRLKNPPAKKAKLIVQLIDELSGADQYEQR